MNKQQTKNKVNAPSIDDDTRIIDYINEQIKVMNDINADTATFSFENDVYALSIKIKRIDNEPRPDFRHN